MTAIKTYKIYLQPYYAVFQLFSPLILVLVYSFLLYETHFILDFVSLLTHLHGDKDDWMIIQ
jgi:hypothetical protein